MQLLRDAQHHLGELLASSSTYNGGPEQESATKTAAVPGHPATDIPDLALLASWLLLLSRYAGDDNIQLQWGRQLPGGVDALAAVPGSDGPASAGSNHSISELIEVVGKLLREDDGWEKSRLGDFEKLFFHDRAIPAKAEGGDGQPKWSFRLEVCSLDEQLNLRAQWRSDTMTTGTAEKHLEAFIDILALVLESLSNPTVDVRGPLARELEQIWSWNAVVPPKIDECMHDLIARRASLYPDAPAVSAWDGEFTNSQLGTLSTHLAVHLRSLGVDLGSPVPLCFEKSKWTVVGVLAIMKAGGAFVLMDPSQPPARLATIVLQTGAKVVLSSRRQEPLASEIAPESRVVVVSDATWKLCEEQSLPVELPPVAPDTPMYIIFTSGSTGKPKGVVISHAQYTSGALPRTDAVGYVAGLRVFEFASYAFDVCIDCIVCTLAKGGCVCVPTDEARMNDLSGAIRASKARMAHMTPSVARVLDSDILPSLDVLGLGGEAVSAGDTTAWSRHTKVVIAYGPSECTVGCTINNTVENSAGYANIGKGVGGLTWIVDSSDHDRLVPPGAVGELLVEGPVVGVGYLGEPEKTAEVFIEDPAWLVAGSASVRGRHGRLYKTGDLVRYDPDGSGAIVFVGRKDQQVKLRGQRVELAEVEHHLRDNIPSTVKMAAEVIKPGGGEPTLAAFLAEPTESAPEATSEPAITFSPALSQALASIDARLEAEVPQYMVPTAYIPLRQIPSLVSGKTDRKRLREMGNAMTREQIAKFRIVADKSKPETEAEVALHRIWKRLLGEDLDISLSDRFFTLGGDSLKAMKLVAAARAEGLSLTVASVFGYPTLRDMAAVAKKQEQSSPDGVAAFSLLGDGWSVEDARAEAAKLCEIDEAAVEDIYPCTPLQEALMALSAKIKDAYVAQREMELQDAETARRFQSAFEETARDCPILRTRVIQVPGHGLMQVVVREAIRWRSAASVQEYLEEDRGEEVELGKPLVRYGLVTEEGTGKIHFVLTIHHSLYDGWSIPLVIDRVNRAYQGSPITRPAAFKDFIHCLDGMNRRACEQYWREQLRGATGRQFPPLPWEGYQAKPDSLLEVHVPLSGRPASNTTVAAVIRGAWALVASNYAASTDMVFGETLTGRNAPVHGVEEIEGPMITTVPARVRIDRSASVAEYLQSIHDQMVAQIPYEHTGLQHIRRLSDDALQACELRTGLVLHPSTEEAPETSADRPADGLMPAGDDEAAQEALKFNTYGLMLVCSLDPKGFLVMASFDSKMVDKSTMERVLEQFSNVTGQLCAGTDGLVGDIDYLAEKDRDEVWRVAVEVKPREFDPCFGTATAAWIVDPADIQRLLPRGAVGELVLEGLDGQSLPAVENPQWLLRGACSTEGRHGRVYKTGKLARIAPSGVLEPVTQQESITASTPSGPAPQVSSVAVATGKQRKLRTLWGRVLRLDEKDIGLGDNFFRLGGDSITAMKLVSEARLEGLKITVAEVFANRTLFEMANVLQLSAASPDAASPGVSVKPYQSLDVGDVTAFVEKTIRPKLPNPSWKFSDVLPTRPLQEIAVRGTVQLPRYSMRYELLHFASVDSLARLKDACQKLVARNEVLRTAFVEADGTYFGVVLDQFTVPIIEYDFGEEAAETFQAFTESVCKVDVQARLATGEPFVKFFLIHGPLGRTTLIFRLSHAQYDEMCLPLFLRQLAALAASGPQQQQQPVPASVPFSAFVHHVTRDVVPRSLDYWRELLRGSSLTVLRPDPAIPVTSRRHYATSRAVDIAPRPRDVTVATLPTAAWGLCLARRLGARDVVFGEVTSGRNTDLPGCDAVAGPCWQYVPVRVRLGPGRTGMDLLRAVQHQHVASSRFEGPALRELVAAGCCPGWPAATDWFDSVVHQDVEHVESLGFGGGTGCTTQAVYVHEEPLREWKVQAYHSGETLTMEIVTLESWGAYAEGLLDDLVAALQTLVRRPGEVV